MSEWLDSSLNSNKLKQSYFQNFIDVSGVVSIRNNKNLNIYNEGSSPEFSINSQEIRLKDQGLYYDISNSKLRYLVDVSENIQDQLDDLITRTQNLTTNTNVTNTMQFTSDISFNNNVDVCGNFYAQYPVASIPPTAIEGVGTVNVDGNVVVSVYTSDEITFDDDDFVLVKEDDDKIQITPYGIFVTENVIFDENDSFALFKENHTPKIEQNLSLLGTLSVSGEVLFDDKVSVPTVTIDTSDNQAASCEYVQNQNYIISSSLMKQF